ncbi:hypothetical protein L1987_19029 [Smallanthus sonchifolius]|uniref:Uncharacterized protein n=1 Tax=Smallanthus sonchifolius TaxID=185202 RepID=A0ACB9J3J9_9ASTR|nr:hypothetical protein L1987_19029 [Smallanthus sonchifolius]
MPRGTRGKGNPTVTNLFLTVREEPNQIFRDIVDIGVMIEYRLDLNVYPTSIPENCYLEITPCIFDVLWTVRLKGDMSFGYFIIVGETERWNFWNKVERCPRGMSSPSPGP